MSARRTQFTAISLAIGLTGVVAAPLASALIPNVVKACQFNGTAKFVHGPNSTAHAYRYTLAGKVNNCQDNDMSPPSGTIATLTSAAGSGTCAQGSTAGVALVTWQDRTTTLLNFSTSSAGPAVLWQAKAILTYRVGKRTYRTTRYKGATSLGSIVFGLSPTECAGTGVTSATASGFLGVGSDQ